MFYGRTRTQNIINPPYFLGRSNLVNTSSIITGNNQIINPYGVILIDTHNALNPTTGIYTIPIKGYYHFMFIFSTRDGDLCDFSIRKNSITQGSNTVMKSGLSSSYWNQAMVIANLECQQNDTIDIFVTFWTGSSYECFLGFTGFMRA